MPRTVWLALVLGAWACGGDAAGQPPIDPGSLDPDAVVLAAGSGGGFLGPGAEEFFIGERHGLGGLWVFGDGSAIELAGAGESGRGYRVYRQGRVDDAVFVDLLGQAQALGLAGDHAYSICHATDGGSQVIAAALPGVSFRASSYMGFWGYSCEGLDAPDEGTRPPEDVVAFAKALFAVELIDPVELAPERLILAGIGVQAATRSPGDGCAEADTTDWAFADLPLPEGETGHLWTQPVSGARATDVRAFVRAHLTDDPFSISFGYGSACVRQGGALHRVFYDDQPEGEERWPF